ncbi:MAG: hypothetical protein KC535_00300 [Nanoarchaeota archaeon]|nr:hypothetical protein [Nanoarchaeota archaeon]
MKKAVLFGGLILLSLLLSACGGQTLYMCSDGTPGGGQIPDVSKSLTYFCPDGKETDDFTRCTFVKEITITQKDAETKSINFVNGYVRASGWSGTLINVYPEEGDFYGQLVISKNGEQSYETLVKVDGVKGSVSCFQNCLYTTQIS